jgi:hypothetical protein
MGKGNQGERLKEGAEMMNQAGGGNERQRAETPVLLDNLTSTASLSL